MKDSADVFATDAEVSESFAAAVDEIAQRVQAGQAVDMQAYYDRYPLHVQELKELLPTMQLLVDLNEDAGNTDLPERIGRYRIKRILGKGGFGLVYLAQDEQLDRPVAVKVPHAHRIARPEDAQAYLAEARTVANLDHPGIVPVHDVGSTEDCPCYIVSKYIPGNDLSAKMKRHRLKYREAAELVATVAEALHYAHMQGLVHLDVKPGNILIDHDGKPYVVDFGLALREESIGKGFKYAGTPAYMSPEQALGEGHRVDRRSDIFSLGIVFYELLGEHRPFRDAPQEESFVQSLRFEAKSLRHDGSDIPKELERICHKAIAKRVSERYSTAKDFAEDLWLFLQEPTQAGSSASPGGVTVGPSEKLDSKAISASSASGNLGSSDSQPIKIVPKGLRSFDAHDADFFLELLPGPRDRDGLPDSLRFWKTRIEEVDSDDTFSVGLIYGPSGCGKSSMVKAGLLPRLSEDVISVYIEATPEETETRLLRGLQKRCPALPENLGLKDTLAAIRRGQGIPAGQKVLIVLDQFEQWLHAKKQEENSELIQALRQCDGGRVQCIVMVRDDFWLAVSRFLRELEIRLLEGHNVALIDLFDIDHARKVLAAFGRAFDKLPEQINETTKTQKDFLKQAVAGLAEEGKVICVRLAIFAEMMKATVWTPAKLKQVGGTEGVGVTFLEETFSSSTATPEHRFHQQAARAVLKDLLPDSGTNIKGSMRSYAELLEASGYGNRPRDFDDLIRILDSEIRLITPTDPEGKGTDNDLVTQTQAGQKYFQLTHDYLVHSLRDWLTRKQKETRKGRAELKLFDTSVTWNAKPENRFLPSLAEWINIRLLTDKNRWTEPQRGMIRKADRCHLSRLMTAVGMLGLITVVGLWTWYRVDQNRRVLLAEKAREQEATRIEGLVGRLVSAEPAQLFQVVKELDANPELAATFLSPLVASAAKTNDEKRAQLHACLAMVARDKSLVKPLLEELLTNKVAYISPIRQQLSPYAAELTAELWGILRDDKAEAARRFHAAMALAAYVPDSEAMAWTDQDVRFVAEQLVSANAESQPLLREYLRPIRGLLLADLEKIFGDSKATEAQRVSAANAFADYAEDDIAKLSQLLVIATPQQYGVHYPLVAATPAPSTAKYLARIAATPLTEDPGNVERVRFGQHRANAAVTLLRLGEREKMFSVFEVSEDPEALTQFIFRCRDRGVRVEELLDCLRLVSDAPVDRYPRHTRYSLLLALGEYALSDVPESQRDALVKQLGDWYRNDPSSGVHGAVGWLLRQWGRDDVVRQVDQTPVPYAPDREWFTLAVAVTPTPAETPQAQEEPTGQAAVAAAVPGEESDPGSEASKPKDEAYNIQDESNISEPLLTKTFYYTFMVFPAGDYLTFPLDRSPDWRPVKLTRYFAILDREITMEELIAFHPGYEENMKNMKAQPQDAGFAVNWYDSVGFCRWLGQQSGLVEADQPYAAPESLGVEEYPRDPNPKVNWAPREWPVDIARPGFRLPTATEWEIACMGGAVTALTNFGFGSDKDLLGRFGWFTDNSGMHVHPTRQLRPNLRGLFDLHGNMFEWTHDWYSSRNVRADRSTKATDPLGPTGGSHRQSRGGSWFIHANGCSTFFDGAFEPSHLSHNHGFRLALTPSAVPRPELPEGK